MIRLLTAKETEASCTAARETIERLYEQCLANQFEIQQLSARSAVPEDAARLRRLQNEVEEWSQQYIREIEKIRIEHNRFMHQFEEIKLSVYNFKDQVEDCLSRFNPLLAKEIRTVEEERELLQLVQQMEDFKTREKEINHIKQECGMIQGQYLLFGEYLKNKGLMD